MNRQNFESKDRFPLSTQALAFMQEMILASANLARIGGDNYILSGCEITGNHAAAGVIVIDGEVMPFEGGTIVPTITIVEHVEHISANGLTFDKARVTRKARFASGTGTNYYPWANFKPLRTNRQLEEVKATIKYVDDEIAKIQAGGIPTGVIVMWSGTEASIPKGWTLCDGREFAPGKFTPNLSGRFIVGFNRQVKDYDQIGKTGGEKAVTLTEPQIPAHKHVYSDDLNAEQKFTLDENKYPEDKGGFPKKYANAREAESSADNSGRGTLFYTSHAGRNQQHENRPPYYVLAFIIKIDSQN